MIIPTVSALIDQASQSYLIDKNWMKAIIQQESNFNEYAVRYEPAYTYLFNADKFAEKLHISYMTEIQCQKMSWGLAQLMGALAREQGHEGPMGELFIPEVNIKHLCLYIHKLKQISPCVDDIFAMYNGGPGAIHMTDYKYPNQAYVDSTKKYLQEFESKS